MFPYSLTCLLVSSLLFIRKYVHLMVLKELPQSTAVLSAGCFLNVNFFGRLRRYGINILFLNSSIILRCKMKNFWELRFPLKSCWVTAETRTELRQLLFQTGPAMMKHVITGFLSHQENISSNHSWEHQVEIPVCIMGSPS